VVRYRHVGPVDPETWTTTLKPLLDKLEAEA
jgi:hypothetical protein